MKLKPILVKFGLNPNDETTLTDIKAFLDNALPETQRRNTKPMSKKKDVFVVHGRNEPARKAMFEFLRASGLNPLEWGQAVKMTGKVSPFVGEILDAAFDSSGAVVVLLMGDDLASLREEFRHAHDPDYETAPSPQARPNVLFEAGMAFGRHPEKTILVQIGGVMRPFSDIAGKHIIHFRGEPQQRNELGSRLQNAGCDVNDAGSDWLSSGDFTESIRLATY
jgi:predicted nucleotide-binding protein